MTKLAEWCVALGTSLSIWYMLYSRQIDSSLTERIVLYWIFIKHLSLSSQIKPALIHNGRKVC